MNKGEMISTTGILYPVFEDYDDVLSGVMLSASDDKEYLIEGDRFINEFMSLCQEEIRVKGRRSFRNGQWYLRPHDYEIAVRDSYSPDLRDYDFEAYHSEEDLYL